MRVYELWASEGERGYLMAVEAGEVVGAVECNPSTVAPEDFPSFPLAEPSENALRARGGHSRWHLATAIDERTLARLTARPPRSERIVRWTGIVVLVSLLNPVTVIYGLALLFGGSG